MNYTENRAIRMCEERGIFVKVNREAALGKVVNFNCCLQETLLRITTSGFTKPASS